LPFCDARQFLRKFIGPCYSIIASVPVRVNCCEFRTRLDRTGRGVEQLTGLSEFRLIRLYQIIAWAARARRQSYRFPRSVAREIAQSRIDSSSKSRRFFALQASSIFGETREKRRGFRESHRSRFREMQN